MESFKEQPAPDEKTNALPDKNPLTGSHTNNFHIEGDVIGHIATGNASISGNVTNTVNEAAIIKELKGLIANLAAENSAESLQAKAAIEEMCAHKDEKWIVAQAAEKAVLAKPALKGTFIDLISRVGVAVMAGGIVTGIRYCLISIGVHLP